MHVMHAYIECTSWHIHCFIRQISPPRLTQMRVNHQWHHIAWGHQYTSNTNKIQNTNSRTAQPYKTGSPAHCAQPTNPANLRSFPHLVYFAVHMHCDPWQADRSRSTVQQKYSHHDLFLVLHAICCLAQSAGGGPAFVALLAERAGILVDVAHSVHHSSRWQRPLLCH